MTIPDTAFILAAGLGTRMRPLTDTCPKPMLLVAGKPIIGHVLDRLIEAGVRQVVVNLHYLPEKLEAYLHSLKNPAIKTIHEPVCLETGGGVRNALSLLPHDAPFYVCNGDLIWEDIEGQKSLRTLAASWDSEVMDMLLLLSPLSEEKGDYFLLPDRRLLRRRENENAPYQFIGPRIVHPRIFQDTPEGPFSFNFLFDRAQQQERLFGITHHGPVHHLSTPDDLARTQALFEEDNHP
jgi:N-acetyl-alpha-D-muramate 1-phosphate uridylyltransferase